VKEIVRPEIPDDPAMPSADDAAAEADDAVDDTELGGGDDEPDDDAFAAGEAPRDTAPAAPGDTAVAAPHDAALAALHNAALAAHGDTALDTPHDAGLDAPHDAAPRDAVLGVSPADASVDGSHGHGPTTPPSLPAEAVDVGVLASAAASPTGPAIDIAQLTAMMSQIELRPLDDGRVALALPRPAAAALGGLLRALAAAVEGSPAR
jgi:hypothetical protein